VFVVACYPHLWWRCSYDLDHVSNVVALAVDPLATYVLADGLKAADPLGMKRKNHFVEDEEAAAEALNSQ
jgi:hypothetical protein